jgi:membrane protein YqaA with SNARE-associated domain
MTTDPHAEPPTPDAASSTEPAVDPDARLPSLPPSAPTAERVNLRHWFLLFLAWLGLLGLGVYWGRLDAETGSRFGFVVMCCCAYAFYMSLCNTLFPAPTTWVVMLLASNELGLIGPIVPRIVFVALLGAFATGMANLNEYHVFTFFLQYGWVARVRETRLYGWAARWFSVSPFLILSIISFIPIPVDVVRWLAIAYRYSRPRYLAAYVLGRSLRYALWAIAAVGLNLSFWQIMAIQVALVVLAAIKVIRSAVTSRRRSPKAGASSVEAGEAAS